MARGLGLALGLTLGTAFTAAAQDGQTYVIVISGIGGEPQFSEAFMTWGKQIVDAAQSKYSVPAANITFLAERAGAAPVTGEARKQNVEKVFADVAARANAADLLFVVLIGHGSFRGEESRINLPGPDLSAQEFAVLLNPVKARIAFTNASSASGEWAKVLAGENRAIVTATKSGMERNQSVFGRYFADALAKDVADTDKNGRISLKEAFDYASAEVKRYYEGDKRLLTEHAQMIDSTSISGLMYLGAGGAAGVAVPADASPELRALYTRKQDLEQRIAALRARRNSMEADKYQAELEPLLLELARTDAEIRRRSDGGKS
jgi:hypothetical protein